MSVHALINLIRILKVVFHANPRKPENHERSLELCCMFSRFMVIDITRGLNFYK